MSLLAPDLSSVHITRHSANFIPRNAPVLADVDDVNNNVGFWQPQPDFRIPERLSPGFTNFSDLELEAIYADQVRTFTDYQKRLALHAIRKNADADLVMLYFEQPDGSGHQFLMVDPRQASNPADPNSIGANQDPAKRARYRDYLRTAYRVANEAVHSIIEEVGVDRHGRLRSNVIVVSDHGFAPFHTAVNMGNFLSSRGFDPTKVRALTSGPAVNLYINLQGREPNGTVTPEEYRVLQDQIVQALREFVDTNPNYALPNGKVRVFDRIHRRPGADEPADPRFGLRTSNVIGQDSGDVFATLTVGYNFDGTQLPAVQRKGDDPAATPVILSVPNFYGAHGYDPGLPEMSAIFFAAVPGVCGSRKLGEVRNIDVAPTIMDLLHVRPASTVQGRAIRLCGGDDDHHGPGKGQDDDD